MKSMLNRLVLLGILLMPVRWLGSLTLCIPAQQESNGTIVYENTKYGFKFFLPGSWKGFMIITGEWEGLSLDEPEERVVETGPWLAIRHPFWSAEKPRQDIPILVFTRAQWKALQRRKYHIGAAPIEPGELGHNSAYVFALPARYNYAFPAGYEEVEKILRGNALQPTKIVK